MNIQDTHEKKKLILITIKLIFDYQVRRESYILLFEKEKKQIRNKSKNNEYIYLTLFFLQKQKRKYESEKLKRQ